MLMPKCSLLIERPALVAACSITIRPAAASSGVHSEGSQPSDNRPHRSSAAGAREKGSENQHRSAHRFNEIVGSLMREDLMGSKAGGMVFFQFHAGAQLAKQSAGRIDVVHEGDVLEDNFALGQ